MIVQERVREVCFKWVGSRPITFAEFLELPAQDSAEQDSIVELVDGARVERMAVQLEHEKLLLWLHRLIGDFVEERDLGIVLGSRTPVEISEFRGRLPDLLFVRRDRLSIVQQKAVYGAPDLVVEIISPNDRPSDRLGLETDYRSIGVLEIVFIDQPRQRVRILHKREDSYDVIEMTSGTLTFESIKGFKIETEWLLAEPRPTVRATLVRLLDETR